MIQSDIKLTASAEALLICPRTHKKLVRQRRPDNLKPIQRTGFSAPQFGLTDEMFVAEDGSLAYPIVNGIPALLWPEVCSTEDWTVDLKDLRYHEAYREMEHYNPVSLKLADEVLSSLAYKSLRAPVDAGAAAEQFPDPEELWSDLGSFDIPARTAAYRYIAPVAGKIVVNLGGRGLDAVKLLLAGAKSAILITPMLGEAVFAWRLAEAMEVSDRLSCVLGIGEELPLADGSIDGLTSHGCAHHMRLDMALPEINRVLKRGGRFAATDPWQAPLYKIGTTIFGKREHGLFRRDQAVFCKPITNERLSPLRTVFPSHVVSHHGPVLRYPLLALQKFGIKLPHNVMCRVSALDDRIGFGMGLSPTWGGSLFFGGERL